MRSTAYFVEDVSPVMRRPLVGVPSPTPAPALLPANPGHTPAGAGCAAAPSSVASCKEAEELCVVDGVDCQRFANLGTSTTGDEIYEAPAMMS